MRTHKLGPPRHSHDGKISDDGIAQLRVEIRKGDPHPGDAYAALLSIRETLDGRRPLSRTQTYYLLQALNQFASGKSLEQAFGLKRPRPGRRVTPELRQIEVATEVLRDLLKGGPLDAAAENAGKRCLVGPTQARRYWAAHKLPAIWTLRVERPEEFYPWTDDEVVRLRQILKQPADGRPKPDKAQN